MRRRFQLRKEHVTVRPINVQAALDEKGSAILEEIADERANVKTNSRV